MRENADLALIRPVEASALVGGLVLGWDDEYRRLGIPGGPFVLRRLPEQPSVHPIQQDLRPGGQFVSVLSDELGLEERIAWIIRAADMTTTRTCWLAPLQIPSPDGSSRRSLQSAS